jgi:hypothetical protein
MERKTAMRKLVALTQVTPDGVMQAARVSGPAEHARNAGATRTHRRLLAERNAGARRALHASREGGAVR